MRFSLKMMLNLRGIDENVHYRLGERRKTETSRGGRRRRRCPASWPLFSVDETWIFWPIDPLEWRCCFFSADCRTRRGVDPDPNILILGVWVELHDRRGRAVWFHCAPIVPSWCRSSGIASVWRLRCRCASKPPGWSVSAGRRRPPPRRARNPLRCSPVIPVTRMVSVTA